jgi:hypothetical protein
MEAADGYAEDERRRAYPLYVWMGDVNGIAIYPVPGEGTDGQPLMAANGLTELRTLAGKTRPAYVRITADLRPDPTLRPPDVRAQVWAALVGGATALCYDTPGLQAGDPPNADMLGELKRLNDQITRLGPAVLAGRPPFGVTVETDGNVPCHFKATIYDGSVYIFAQNADAEGRTARATFSIRRWPGGAVFPARAEGEVVDEDRSISIREGQFTDDFGPLMEHIYRISL